MTEHGMPTGEGTSFTLPSEVWFEVVEIHDLAWAISRLGREGDSSIDDRELACRLGSIGDVIMKKAAALKELEVIK